VKNWQNCQKQLSSREKEVTQAEKGTSKIVFFNNTNKTLNVILLNYPVLSNSCYIFKGQTNFCLSFLPTGAEQPRWGDECPLFGHSYPLKDAFQPDQARIGKHSLSS
jgi:hypothetical protein